jgi:tetratricopeptide (TPR) repeat protein
LIRLKRYEEARTMLIGLFGESPDATRADLGSDEVLLLNNLAVAESRLGNTSERFRLLDGISDRVEPLFGAENTVALTLLYNHGTTLLDRGKLSEAEARFRRCLAGFEARTSPGSMQRIRSRGRLAQSVMLQGLLHDEARCDEAIRLFVQMEEAALDLATNTAAATSTRMRSWGDAAAAANNQASIARRIGRLDEARRAIQNADDHLTRVDAGTEPMLDGLVAAEMLRFESDPSAIELISRIEASIETLSKSRRRELAIMSLSLAEHERVKRGDDWFADQCLEIEEILSPDSSPSADLIRLDLNALEPTRGIDGR